MIWCEMKKVLTVFYSTLLLSTGFYAAEENNQQTHPCVEPSQLQSLSKPALSNEIDTAPRQSAKYNPFSDAPIPQGLTARERVVAAIFQLSYYKLALKQNTPLSEILHTFLCWTHCEAARQGILNSICDISSEQLPDQVSNIVKSYIQSYLTSYSTLYSSPHKKKVACCLKKILERASTTELHQAALLLAQPDTESITESVKKIVEKTTDTRIQEVISTLLNIEWSTETPASFIPLSEESNLEECVQFLLSRGEAFFLESQALGDNMTDIENLIWSNDATEVETLLESIRNSVTTLDFQPALSFYMQRVQGKPISCLI